MIKDFLNPEGHQNPISGSKVTAILLKGWILPLGGASSGGGSAPAAGAAGLFKVEVIWDAIPEKNQFLFRH